MTILTRYLRPRIINKLFEIYVGIILLLIVIPFSNDLSPDNFSIAKIRGDYFLHVLGFGLWSVFVWLMQRNLLKWMFYGLFFAVSTEFLQYLLPYRAFNLLDLVANVVGIVLGFVCMSILTRLGIKIPSSEDSV